MRGLGMAAALTMVLVASACSAPTPPLGEDLRPPSDSASATSAEGQSDCEDGLTVAYYYTGPGGATPVEAAQEVARNYDLTLRSTDGRTAEINAFDPKTGDLARIYRVSESNGLWYPDGYYTCAKK